MDPRIIEVRKNILIARELDDSSTFTATINIDFIPDEVIIKNIIFTLEDPDAAQNWNTSIYTDLVSDYIGSFSDAPSGNSVTPNLVFTLRRPINRLYNFSIQAVNAGGTMILYNRSGDLTLHLEFVKYKS